MVDGAGHLFMEPKLTTKPLGLASSLLSVLLSGFVLLPVPSTAQTQMDDRSAYSTAPAI